MSKQNNSYDPFNADTPIMPGEESETGESEEQTPTDWTYDSSSSRRQVKRRREQERRQMEEARREANSYKGTNSQSNSAQQQNKKSSKGCGSTALWWIVIICLLLGIVSTFVSSCSSDEVEEDAAEEEDEEEEEDDGEAIIEAVVSERLQTLQEDEGMLAYVASEFDGALSSEADYGATDLGLDADAFAEWCLTNSTYYYESIYCWSTDGLVKFNISDYNDEVTDFAYEVGEYVNGQGFSYYAGDELGETQLAYIQDLYEELLEDLEEESDYTSCRAEFTLEYGEWVLDEEGFYEELEDAFDFSDTVSTEEQVEVQAALEDQLLVLLEDEEIRALIADEFDSVLSSSNVVYGASDLGLDADAFADWYLSTFWYDIKEVKIYEEDEEESASVRIYLMEWGYEDRSTFTSAIDDYLEEQGLSYYAGDTLNEEQLAYIQTLYEDMLSNFDTGEYIERSLWFDFVGDEWVIEDGEESLDDLLVEAFDFDDYTEDEDMAAVRVLMEERLSALAEDEDIQALVAEEFSSHVEKWVDYYGLTVEDLGLDADAFAEWFLSQLWYDIRDIHIYDAEASITFYVMDLDTLNSYTSSTNEYLSSFGSVVSNYLYESGYSGGELTESQLAGVQELYEDLLENWDRGSYAYCYVTVKMETGEWIIDEDELYSELADAFDTY